MGLKRATAQCQDGPLELLADEHMEVVHIKAIVVYTPMIWDFARVHYCIPIFGILDTLSTRFLMTICHY